MIVAFTVPFSHTELKLLSFLQRLSSVLAWLASVQLYSYNSKSRTKRAISPTLLTVHFQLVIAISKHRLLLILLIMHPWICSYNRKCAAIYTAFTTFCARKSWLQIIVASLLHHFLIAQHR